MPALAAAPPAGGAPSPPRHFASGAGSLPDVTTLTWHGLIPTDGIADKKELDSQTEGFLVWMGDYALANRGGVLLGAVAADVALPNPQFELDAWLLPISEYFKHVRRCVFNKGAQFSVSQWPG